MYIATNTTTNIKTNTKINKKINTITNIKINVSARQNTNKNKFYLGTLNVRTLMTDNRLQELKEAIGHIKWDIIGLCEVRRPGEEIREYSDYIFYFHGEKQGMYGIGFLIKKYLKDKIISLKGISDRIAVLDIQLPGFKQQFTIIQIYAPTEQDTKLAKDKFYKDLTELMQNKNKNVVVIGDFNAKVGSKSNKDEFVLGNHTCGVRNDNGNRLVDFSFENNLKIMNSFFKKRKSRKWTWISPNGRDKNEIDFLLSTEKRIFSDVEVVNKLNFNTDHRMVRGVIKLTTNKSRKHIVSSTKNTISSPIPQKILNNLKSTLDTMKNIKSMQEKYSLLEKELINLHKAGTRTEKKNKLGAEALKLMEERNKMLENRKENHQNIANISKKIQTSIRKHKKTERFNVLRKQIEKTGGIKKGLKQLREYVQWIPNMKVKNKKGDKLTTNRSSIAKIATEFYKRLYSNECEPIGMVSENITDEEEVPCILETETIRAINTQKNDKAPGDDNITNYTLKESLSVTSKHLTQLFNEILDTEQIPKQWTKSTIVLLHKKGDKNEINNYRPISLMSNLYKIFSKILLGRITKQLEENQQKEQAGFRADFSTIDHIHVVKQIIEKMNEYGQEYYMAFVDYNKAFDSLSHNYIWKTLGNQGVHNKYIRIIQEIYKNSTATVQLEHQGEEFCIQRGVKQGDPLSPKLFIAVLENIFRNINWEGIGININGVNLNHLRFADDIVLFAEKPDTLQTMLQELDQESRKAGLSMNPTKTKVMTNATKEHIEVREEVIQYIDEYIYLGQVISTDDQHSKEIDRRISNTWKRYWSLKEIFKNETMPLSVKTKLYNACILPCLTYGCQTWPATTKNNQKLAVCQRSMERSMLNIRRQDRWRISNIRKRTKVIDVIHNIRKLKWNWVGHIMRTNKGKWTKDVIEWYPRNGKRKKGRQIKRWEDDLPKGWRRIARKREEWKLMGEAYVKGHPDQQTGC